MLTPSLDSRIQGALQRAMDDGQIPGGVVLVGKGAEVVCQVALGNRMVAPQVRPMALDTVFDLASVTKPIATATAVMQLVEDGEILLRDPVSRYVPAFTGDGREEATIRHLLTHTTGVPPYKNYLNEFGSGVPESERRPRVVADICTLPLDFPVGTGFSYTCLGYILLTSIVQQVSGLTLDQFARQRTFAPLGMTDTCFSPSPELVERCAATEQLPEGVLCGVVHDENARYLSGVGGNAGLFSTVA